MDKEKLVGLIKQRKTFLCIGLDSDLARLPDHLAASAEGQLQFNKEIIDATRELCVSYKLNTAFYEALGAAGWDCMALTREYIGNEHFVIADAKRGDIGNTCHQYARAFFGEMDFDAITLAPYMGKDSVRPFLEYADKFSILLALTSNPSAENFELLSTGERKLYEEVILQSQSWEGSQRLMYVVGATRPAFFKGIRELAPNAFLLVPGIGAQGGSLEDVAQAGMNKDCGIIVNSSRGIIFASKGKDFAQAAAQEAETISTRMAALLQAGAIL